MSNIENARGIPRVLGLISAFFCIAKKTEDATSAMVDGNLSMIKRKSFSFFVVEFALVLNTDILLIFQPMHSPNFTHMVKIIRFPYSEESVNLRPKT